MKNNLKKMAKAITLGLVLGTTLTATSSVWATETHVKDDADPANAVFTYDSATHWLKWGDSTTASGTRSTAWGDTTTASSFNSTAFGQNTTANNQDATAFGFKTTASGRYSTAWGDTTTASVYAATAFGQGTTASGNMSTAFGYQTTASAQASTAFGFQTAASGNQATAFGQSTKASNFAATAFGQSTTASGMYSTAFGYQTTASGDGATAFGENSKAGGSNSLAALGGVTGDWSGETPTGGANAVAIGVGAIAKADNSVAIGTYAQTGKVNIGAGDAHTVIHEFAVGNGVDNDNKTHYSQITGVADGVDAHDAVNLKQVQNMLGTTGRGEAFTELKDDVAGIHDDINGLNSQIDRMGTRIDKVGAGAAALAAMHPVYDEDSKLTFSAGLGAYRGEQAAAVGMFYRFTDRVMMNAGATVGNNDNMYNVGLNFALDRSVGSKLPSKAVMAKEINSLKTENQEMKQEIAELKAMVQALIANK